MMSAIQNDSIHSYLNAAKEKDTEKWCNPHCYDTQARYRGIENIYFCFELGEIHLEKNIFLLKIEEKNTHRVKFVNWKTLPNKDSYVEIDI